MSQLLLPKCSYCGTKICIPLVWQDFSSLTFACSVCVVMGAIAMILYISWMFVRKQFKGPDVDWELLNRQNELE